MLKLSKIKSLVKERNINLKDLALKIGMTEPGLHQMISNNSTKTSTLTKIADFLGVPEAYFFEDYTEHINQVNDQQARYNTSSKGEMECQKELNAAFKKIIALQEELLKKSDTNPVKDTN